MRLQTSVFLFSILTFSKIAAAQQPAGEFLNCEIDFICLQNEVCIAADAEKPELVILKFELEVDGFSGLYFLRDEKAHPIKSVEHEDWRTLVWQDGEWINSLVPYSTSQVGFDQNSRNESAYFVWHRTRISEHLPLPSAINQQTMMGFCDGLSVWQ